MSFNNQQLTKNLYLPRWRPVGGRARAGGGDLARAGELRGGDRVPPRAPRRPRRRHPGLLHGDPAAQHPGPAQGRRR